ncbi:queuosine precursor transporter [Lutimonas sp.]|uniref:queuosine precursor transporter n=1 Tax=Lutimonas sp. TaxID=1872403 RepID=UPI003D9B518C
MIEKTLSEKDRSLAFSIFLILAAIFIASLVVSNLIFQKFFSWDFFGIYNFEISVGILPYPITFLVTDLISEIYGKKKANQVVITGIFASAFSLLIIMLSDAAPATEWSPIGNEIFHSVFGLSALAVFASAMAYLVAQFVDIRIYHFWKRKTNGRHLWLRNNFSTISSQFLDTFSVLFLLCSFGVIEWDLFGILLLNGFLFKLLVALLDTPILYLFVYWFRAKFNLKANEEIAL